MQCKQECVNLGQFNPFKQRANNLTKTRRNSYPNIQYVRKF